MIKLRREIKIKEMVVSEGDGNEGVLIYMARSEKKRKQMEGQVDVTFSFSSPIANLDKWEANKSKVGKRDKGKL